MKYITILVLASCLAGCFGRKPEKTGLEGKPMPAFNLLLMDSTTRINTSSFPSGEPIVMFFFSPYCPYCRAQTEDIIANMKSFTNIRFYMLTNLPLSQLKHYYNHYRLDKYPNIVVAQDYNSYFVNYFKVTGVPYMAIYSKDKQLKQVLIGKVGTDLIKDIVFE
jgi:thiol-disulfide isomerase/thioredoxin